MLSIETHGGEDESIRQYLNRPLPLLIIFKNVNKIGFRKKMKCVLFELSLISYQLASDVVPIASKSQSLRVVLLEVTQQSMFILWQRLHNGR